MASGSTTAATPAGNCWRCGGQLYENCVHSCSTSVAVPPTSMPDRGVPAPSSERPDRYSTMSVPDLVALILDQLREADHPDEADDCPFCQAVSALNELAGRVSS